MPALAQAVLDTRLIPIEIMCLSLIPIVFFFVFFRNKAGKMISLPAILFASWLLVPALATQSYLLSLYLDYQRFLYFLALPAIICVGIAIASSANALSHAIHFLQARGKLKTKLNLFHLSKKTLTVVLIVPVLVFVLFTPLFALPKVGVIEANYFQVMNTSEYQAIQWIKANTTVGSVCVADADFGWWLSGFAQRPTLSAVNPQYLILQREIAPANIATNLLAADYRVENGLIEIEQTGINANGSSHEIQTILNTSYIHPPVFTLNDSQISLLYRQNAVPQQISLTSLSDSSTHIESNADNATFTVTHENQFLKIVEEITIYKGISFARVSFSLISKSAGVQYDWLQLPFQSRGFPLQHANSIAIVDGTLHELSQIEFPDNKLGSDVVMQQNPDSYALIFNLRAIPLQKEHSLLDSANLALT